MKIIADQNIPIVKETFSGMGEVVTLSGRDIDNGILRDADVLLVRSITKVDEKLLEHTKVKFVGTATIGTDHVDEKYLSEAGIKFASAPGSNADSVAEYIVSALLNLEKKSGFSFSGKSIGIIGCGNVGRRVKKRSSVLGMNCLVNDPPLELSSNESGLMPLDRLLALSDVVTVHVPLIKTGGYPTYRMIDDRFLGMMKPGAVLINTSRGSVMEEGHIKVNRKKLGGLVLDVWNNEPSIDTGMLDITDIATPHIAGYSYDGKIKGVVMLYDALCDFLGIKNDFDFSRYTCANLPQAIDLSDSNDVLFDAVNKAYPIMEDDRNMRRIKGFGDGESGKYFDRLRKEYHIRREFKNFSVKTFGIADEGKMAILKNLGFGII
jgi:erythronate-4-phosphate dehydrogenase